MSKIISIVDYGSQYTQLIARRVRELGFFSEILPCKPGGNVLNWAEVKKRNPDAVIFSGGPSSVYEKGAPGLPQGWQDDVHRPPTLGICYGMQLIAQAFSGKVSPGSVREYGLAKIKWSDGGSYQNVWMSHGDEVTQVPTSFFPLAKSESGIIAAMESKSQRAVCFQFHPEVTHTVGGTQLLKGFLESFCGLTPDWSSRSALAEIENEVLRKVGPEDHVLCALSGGVDSMVAAALVSKIIGKRLHCVFVDHGLLRFDEAKRVMTLFQDNLHLDVQCVDAGLRFLSALRGIEDPEQKRKIIGQKFIDVFKEAANEIEKRIGKRPRFLLQGTLYPDVIESSGFHGAASVTIKTHHNVGGLPKDLGFELLEPFRLLFKDEVRKMGAELDVPSQFLSRHPFPGPGLAIRILGAVEESIVKTLQKADEIFIQELKVSGLYNEIWQAFAAFLPVKTVGVQGDGRTHENVIVLRAVSSQDGMTAQWYPLPYDFLGRVSSRICNEVRGINRVVYDVSSKPPATIEWE